MLFVQQFCLTTQFHTEQCTLLYGQSLPDLNIGNIQLNNFT